MIHHARVTGAAAAAAAAGAPCVPELNCMTYAMHAAHSAAHSSIQHPQQQQQLSASTIISAHGSTCARPASQRRADRNQQVAMSARTAWHAASSCQHAPRFPSHCRERRLDTTCTHAHTRPALNARGKFMAAAVLHAKRLQMQWGGQATYHTHLDEPVSKPLSTTTTTSPTTLTGKQ